jgi:hypothetical protein
MVTVTFCTVPRPATVMFDGYGLAGPLSGMRIGTGLMKETGVQVGVGVGVGVPAPPYLCPPLAAPPEPLQKYWVKFV